MSVVRSSFGFLFTLLLFTSARGEEARPAGSPDARYAISQLRTTLARYDHVSLHASTSSQYSNSAAASEGSLAERSLLEIRQVGSRALLSIKNTTERSGSDPWRLQHDYVIYDNGDVLSCQADLGSSLQQVDGVTENLGFRLYSKRLSGVQTTSRSSVYKNLNDAGVTLWVVGYAPLLEYIDHATEVTATPAEDGITIFTSSEYGDLTLMLSKTYGWHPKKFTISKTSNHRANRGVVGDITMTGDEIWPSGGVKRIEWAGEVLSFANNSGHPYPKEIAVKKSVFSESGPIVTITSAISIESLIFAPRLEESDLETNIVAPVGFQVSVDGADHLPYRWDGSAAVPGVPEAPERVVQSLAMTGSSRRAVLIALNAALVLGLVILLLRRRKALK